MNIAGISLTAQGKAMDHPNIFSATLGLTAPWLITAIKFSKEERRLDLTIEYQGSNSCCCPVCGCEANTNECAEETWHHSDFFRYATYLHARVPLVKCTDGCGCHKIPVPWARPGARFHLLEPTPRS